jgi:hypothetical protein
MNLGSFAQNHKRSKSLNTSFDWSHVNIEDMEHYERAIKIASIRAEKTLGYSKIQNANQIKKENFSFEKTLSMFPTFDDV